MRKLIRAADHERVERVARIELMIHGLEVQPRLLARRVGRARTRQRVRVSLQTNSSCVSAMPDFDQHGLQQLAVGFGQPLAKRPRGHAHNQLAVLVAFLPCGAKPGGKAVRVHPPFHVLQNVFPRIHRSMSNSGEHTLYFHRCGKPVEKNRYNRTSCSAKSFY